MLFTYILSTASKSRPKNCALCAVRICHFFNWRSLTTHIFYMCFF